MSVYEIRFTITSHTIIIIRLLISQSDYLSLANWYFSITTSFYNFILRIIPVINDNFIFYFY